MRKKYKLIKNKAFYRMVRNEFKSHPQNIMGFKRWLVKYWDDLLEAWEFLTE